MHLLLLLLLLLPLHRKLVCHLLMRLLLLEALVKVPRLLWQGTWPGLCHPAYQLRPVQTRAYRPL